MFKIITISIISLIPGLILIIQSGIELQGKSEVITIEHGTNLKLLNDNKRMQGNILFALEVSRLLHATQKERGITSLFISSQKDETLKARVAELQTQTDAAVADLSEWHFAPELEYFRSKQLYLDHLQYNRDLLEQSTNCSYRDVVAIYSADNAIFVRRIVDAVTYDKNNDNWAQIVAFHMLTNAKEQIGIERAIGTNFFTEGSFSLDDVQFYKGHNYLGLKFIDQFEMYSSLGSKFMKTMMSTTLEDAVDSMRRKILTNRTDESSIAMGTMWFDNMTSYINIINAVHHKMTETISNFTNEEIFDYKLQLVFSILELVGALIIVPVIAFFIYKATKKMREITDALQEKSVNLEKEKARTEILLSQMLPMTIARKLRLENTVDPESYSSATVMYSNLCDFSYLCNKMSPGEMIDILGGLYEVIENRINVYNVCKVGTIGNTYMVVSGLHRFRSPRHAYEVACLAIDVLDRVKQMTIPHIPGEKIKLRIGINSGPIMAGVVSSKPPRYCVLGETVNIAACMETTCLPNHIQMTESTQEELRKTAEFIVVERDDIPIEKDGVAGITTYWLTGKKSHVVDHTEIDF